MQKTNVLITAVGGPAGLSALRSLKIIERFKLVCTDADPLAPGLYDTSVTSYTLPFANDKKYIQKLIEIATRESVDVIFPCSDEEILQISKNKKILTENFVLPIPDYEIIKHAIDKYQVVQAAQKVGIRTPVTFILTDEKEMRDISRELEFPLVVRPRISRGGRGIYLCENLDDAIFAFRKIEKDFKGGAMVQEYIPGGMDKTYVIQSLWNKVYQPIAVAVMRKLRQKPTFGGVAVAGETVHRKDLESIGIQTVKSVGEWIGPVGVEIKESTKNGEFYLMEVNPRLQGVTYLFTVAGVNFPYLWALIALDEELPEIIECSKKTFVRTWEDRIIEYPISDTTENDTISPQKKIRSKIN